jgi:hypothetical protein
MIRYSLYGLLAGALIGFYVCRTYTPRIETRLETKEVEVVRNNVVTRTIEVVKDGVKTVETVVIDKTVHTDTKATVFSSKEVKDKAWRVGLLTNSFSVSPMPVYTANVQYRVLGPLSIMGQVNTTNQYSVGLSYEF